MNTATAEKPTVTAMPGAAPAPSAQPLARTGRVSLVEKFAHRYSIEPDKLMGILKATAFRQSTGEVSNEQMAALLIVADQYGLNPFTREIFAFPDKGGIVPVVSVDGWSRIVNDHEQYNGVTLEITGAGPADWACEATMHRKDRDNPTTITEFFAEVKRDTKPWQSHPRRMLRHKAFIQCARIAFGFAGIYDEDEAERIIEGEIIERGGVSVSTADLNNEITGRKPAASSQPETVVEDDDGGHTPPAESTVRTTEPPNTPPPGAAQEQTLIKHSKASLLAKLQGATTREELDEIALLALDHLEGSDQSEVIVAARGKKPPLGKPFA